MRVVETSTKDEIHNQRKWNGVSIDRISFGLTLSSLFQIVIEQQHTIGAKHGVHAWMKHIDVNFTYIQDQINLGDVKVYHI